MKNLIFTFILCFSASLLPAGEYTIVRNTIRSGSKKELRLIAAGQAFMVYGNKSYFTGRLSIGTRGGYFNFSNAKSGKKFSNPEKGFWEWTGNFPADRTGQDTIKFTQSFELTPHGTIEANFTWEAAKIKSVKDTFYTLQFSMAALKDKDILVNGEKVRIPNVTKYGFYRKNNVENPELLFYSWDKERKFSIQGEGKVSLVFQALKDKSVTIRIYPASGSDSLKLIFKM